MKKDLDVRPPDTAIINVFIGFIEMGFLNTKSIYFFRSRIILLWLLPCLLAGLLAWPAVSLAQPSLTLQDYLNQVEAQNETYRSNVMLMKALKLREAQASLDFMPELTGNYTYQDDKRLLTELFYGGETINQSANLTVNKKFRTGTQVSFGYGVNYGTVYQGLTVPGAQNYSFPVALSNGYYTASPTLSITQPLWKDWGAALSKANEEAQLASDKAQASSQRYTGQQVAYNAENAYWRMDLERQIVIFDQESIDRTTKILERNRRRVSMNVADRSDLLQSQAALQSKELQYQSDLEDLKTAANDFNSLRNAPGDQVPEQLQPIDPYLEKYLPRELVRTGVRADVIAAQENARSQRANARANIEQLKPDISITGSVQPTGLGPTFKYASGESWNFDNPVYSAGLKLSVPLDVSAVKKINEGYEATAEAATLVADRAQYDLDQDWNNLQRNFKDDLTRLDMAKKLEDVQKEKLLHERVRFAAGRTTSFQVLQFEDDFTQAQLTRLRVENDLVTLRARARLYNGETL